MDPKYLGAFQRLRDTLATADQYGELTSLIGRVDEEQKKVTDLNLRDDAYVFLTVNLYWLGALPWNVANPGQPFVPAHQETLLNDFTRVCVGAARLAKAENLDSIPARLVLREFADLYELLAFPAVDIWG